MQEIRDGAQLEINCAKLSQAMQGYALFRDTERALTGNYLVCKWKTADKKVGSIIYYYVRLIEALDYKAFYYCVTIKMLVQ